MFEGLTYALVPRQMQKHDADAAGSPPEQLRVMGTVVLAVGVFVIWLAQISAASL